MKPSRHATILYPTRSVFWFRKALWIVLWLIPACFNRSVAQYELPLVLPRNDTSLIKVQMEAVAKIKDADSAIAAFKLLLHTTEQYLLVEESINILASLGVRYLDKDELVMARSYLHRGIHLARINGIKGKTLHRLYNNLALVCHDSGESDSAIFYHLKNISIAQSSNLKSEEASSYNNLSPIFEDLRDFKQAIYYLNKSLKISEQTNDYELISNGYLNLGTTYLRMTDTVDRVLRTGLDWLLKGLRIAEEHQDQELSRKFFNAIGLFYQRKQMYQKAISYFEKALQIKGIRASDEAAFLVNLSATYCYILNYRKAGEMAIKALEKVRQTNRTNFYATTYCVLAYSYQRQGKYREAGEYYIECIKLLEKSYNESTRNKVQNLRFQYETAHKDRDLISKQLKITQQKAQMDKIWIVTIALVTISLLVALAVGLYLRYRYRMNKQQEQQSMEIASWRASLEGEEKERSRLARELHDNIGGNLSTLKMWFGNIRNNKNSYIDHQDQECHNALHLLEQALTEVHNGADLAALKIVLANIRNHRNDHLASQEQDYKGALHLLDHTLTEVRNTAHHLMPELLLRLGLVEAIRVYCSDIQRATAININYEYLGYIGPLDNNIDLLVYRMVQELVQNVVKHAKATELLVQLTQFNHTLSITIEDNGQGMDIAQESQLQGMGLSSIRDSIAKLNGKFVLQSEAGNGTTIELTIHTERNSFLSEMASVEGTI